MTERKIYYSLLVDTNHDNWPISPFTAATRVRFRCGRQTPWPLSEIHHSLPRPENATDSLRRSIATKKFRGSQYGLRRSSYKVVTGRGTDTTLLEVKSPSSQCLLLLLSTLRAATRTLFQPQPPIPHSRGLRVTERAENLWSKLGQVIQSAANVLPCLPPRDALRCFFLSGVRLLV